MSQGKATKYIIYSLIAGVFWGTSFPIVKLGLRYISPIWFSQMRLILAFLCLLPLLKRRHIIFKFPYEYWLLGLFNAFGFLLQFLGMQYTSASKASFYVNTNLIFVAMLSYLIYREVFGWSKLLGLFLALVGIYFLSIGNQPISVLFRGELKGDLLVLSAGLSWAIFMILNKKMVQHPDYSVLETVALFLFTSAILMSPVSIFLEPFPVAIAWQGWVILLVSSSISLALPFYFWSLGLKGLTPTVSALLILVEILIAVALSFLFLGEKLTGIELLGAGFLLGALILASLGTGEKQTP